MLVIEDKLKEEIEQKKREMILNAKNKGMTNPETVYCSQELDKLIFKFQALSFHKIKC